MKKIIVVLAAGVLLFSANAASAHTKGGQTIDALPYPPILLNGVMTFMATADTDCTTGSYGTVSANGTHSGGCVTANRVIRIAIGERKCINGTPSNCLNWSAWVYSADASKACPKTNNHCTSNSVTASTDWPCASGHEYRTRAKAGYVGAQGVWYWTAYKYSGQRRC